MRMPESPSRSNDLATSRPGVCRGSLQLNPFRHTQTEVFGAAGPCLGLVARLRHATSLTSVRGRGQRAEELLLGYRLDEVHIEASVGGTLPILLLPPPRQRDQHGGLAPGTAPDLPGRLIAVHLRH